MMKNENHESHDERVAPRYLQELKSKAKMLERSIKKTEQKLYEMKVSDKDFMKVYDALNLLRIDLMTVESRIKNFGKDRSGFEEVYLPKSNQLKSE